MSGFRERLPTLFKMDSKAMTSIIGLILLLGLVSVTAVGILVIADGSISSAQNEAENERVEQAFIALSETVQTSASQRETTKTIDLDVGESGAVVKEDTGTINVDYEDLEGTLHEEDRVPFGTIEYESDDGTKIAYEAGAVFRETGNETQVVSGPDIFYDKETRTLNYPILDISGDDQLESGDIQFDHKDVEPEQDVVDNKIVLIEIESEYWRGWEEHFRKQVDDRGVQAEPLAGEKGRVTVNLGRVEFATPFENAVFANGDLEINGGAAEIKGDVKYNGSRPNDKVVTGSVEETNITLDPIDDVIDEKIKKAKEEGYRDISTELENSGMHEEPYGAGKYYAKNPTTADVTFDLSDGDIELIVEGDFNVDGEFRVEDWDPEQENELRIYTDSPLEISRRMCLDKDRCKHPQVGPGEPETLNPHQLQVYGKSTFEMQMGGNPYFEGVVYAPSNDSNVQSFDFSGTPHIDGSIVAGSAELSGNPEIRHHEELKWFDPQVDEFQYQPPPLTYLNMAYHEIELTQN